MSKSKLSGALHTTTIPLRVLRDALRLPTDTSPRRVMLVTAKNLKICALSVRTSIREEYDERHRVPQFAMRLYNTLLDEEQKMHLNNVEK